jgi:four helix bundle protein
MSFAESFEDLKAWQRARTLTSAIYNTMRACKDYAFRDQIQRAATSVMKNISESFERRTKKDFAHFLDLAKGSAGEVRSMLYLGEDRGYIAAKAAEPLRADYKELSKSIGALAASLRRQ